MGEVLCWIGNAYVIVLIGYVILAWVPRPPEPIMPLVRVVRALVDPVVTPLRRVIPPLPLGNVNLDLSILVLFFGLQLLILPLLCSL